MALSLDYIGKYVLVLVALAAAIGLIVQFSGDVRSMIPGLNPTDNGGTEPEVVDVTAGSASAQAQRLGELAQLCYDRYLENPQQSFTCFIARKESGTFSSPSPSAIKNNVKGEAKQMIAVQNTPLNEATVTIEYSLSQNKIVISD
ncbi:MAG: hypothetical protein SVU32_05370 [Candidatus Nanohaloarchaea archaeon]|nr:hypothetical protein [Candidatus Nanohaloarchaea archaeon]